MTCRILSIDGGGIRGILPARVLVEIERRTGKRTHELFNLIAGTSTGGLLALGLAIPRPGGSEPYTAEELLDLYVSKGPKIFATSFWHTVSSLGATTDERYPSDNIEAVLRELLGDRWLSECIPGVDVLIPAYEIEKRESTFFKSWYAQGEGLVADDRKEQRDFLARDVARATSAAPTYFEPAKLTSKAGETSCYVDGGVFANNPAMAAVVSGRWLYPEVPHDRYCVLSLGTGSMEREIPYEEAKDFGLLGWARRVISAMMSGNSETVDYQMKEIGEAFKFHYLRLEVDLGKEQTDTSVNDDFDDASPANLRALLQLADELVARNETELGKFIDNLKQVPKAPRMPVALANAAE